MGLVCQQLMRKLDNSSYAIFSFGQRSFTCMRIVTLFFIVIAIQYLVLQNDVVCYLAIQVLYRFVCLADMLF
jgi:hypothetical protein